MENCPFVMVSLVAASCGTHQLTSYEPQKDYFQTITSSYELKRKMKQIGCLDKII